MVQFILSDNLDGNLSTSLALDSLVDVREGTVTHLFDKSETLESLQSAQIPEGVIIYPPRILASSRSELARPQQSSRLLLGN